MTMVWLPTACKVARRTSTGISSRSATLSSGPGTNPNLENSKLHQKHWTELYLGTVGGTVHHKEKEVTRLEPKE